ncbi:MAG: GAF domain-containing protein [Chitinivibrionales bacterium]|nr:GAF domain-containing protein [Chitinivibrionales bacterium]MBD3396985.1 GAF domain-containing protein [Chitinivibrionales bacterium]
MPSPVLVDSQTAAAHALSGRIVTVGTSGDCHIRIPGKKSSPPVAHLIFAQGAYSVQALTADSRIHVNGKSVGRRRQRLTHGDTVTIGDSEFAYREQDRESPGEGPAARGPVQDLISVVVSLLKNSGEDVSERLVASVSRLLKCDAARLVAEDSAGRHTIARYPESAALERFSGRAIDWAQQSDKTVLVHNDDWRESQESMSSLEKNLVASVLCAPLKDDARVVGYLYLDRLQSSEPFAEEDRVFCDTLTPLFSTILSMSAQHRRQRDTIARLQESRIPAAGGMVYESDEMARVLSLAERLAPTDSPVLILGETGTGKELMARYIHENSSRADNAFRAVNCGAIPEALIESELFGHEKGAFTGATHRKKGLFESANGGSVLLDEVGELPVQLQVKLLRVLQESEITRVGGTEVIPVDIRILAATNRNLEADVSAGRFRQDLFFRLNVLTVTLPPLRERGRDAALLAEYFLKRYCEQFGLPLKELSAEARKALFSHAWPGNIRELENVIQKTALLSSSNKIAAHELQFPGRALFGRGSQAVTTLKDARAEAEKTIITRTLAKTQGNISLAAKILDIDRKWLMKKMDELGVQAGDFREESRESSD